MLYNNASIQPNSTSGEHRQSICGYTRIDLYILCPSLNNDDKKNPEGFAASAGECQEKRFLDDWFLEGIKERRSLACKTPDDLCEEAYAEVCSK